MCFISHKSNVTLLDTIVLFVIFYVLKIFFMVIHDVPTTANQSMCHWGAF
jgi:hypothetical protein